MLNLLRRHPLLRFLAMHFGFGLLVAALAVGGLIGFDVFGLRHLILADRSPVLALVLLIGGFTVTFASTVMGSAIMGLGYAPDQDGGTPARENGDNATPVVVEHRRS